MNDKMEELVVTNQRDLAFFFFEIGTIWLYALSALILSFLNFPWQQSDIISNSSSSFKDFLKTICPKLLLYLNHCSK